MKGERSLFRENRAICFSSGVPARRGTISVGGLWKEKLVDGG